jgi:integrase/recombinase XerD
MNKLTKQTYDKAEKKMHLLNLSKDTQKSYLGVIYNFLMWIDVPPSKVTKNHFSNYVYEKSHQSRSQQNRYISGLKFLYKEVFKKKIDVSEFKRPKKEKKLPRILSHDQIMNCIEKISNWKHYMIFCLAYSCSLRRSEVINIKLGDINYSRMAILIRQAKGSKDRYVKLSPKICMLLRTYILIYNPTEYLFNGENKLQYSGSSLYKLARKYFGTDFHHIRHASATKIYESNDIYLLSKHLGHRSTKPTEIYIHLSNDSIQKINTPI